MTSLRNLFSFTSGEFRTRSSNRTRSTKLDSTDGKDAKEPKADSSPYEESINLVTLGNSHATIEGDYRSLREDDNYNSYQRKDGIQVKHKVEQTSTPRDVASGNV